MSKAIRDIQNRISKINTLMGTGFCESVDRLTKTATEQDYINAWNNDQHIISGIINDVELCCGAISIEDYD